MEPEENSSQRMQRQMVQEAQQSFFSMLNLFNWGIGTLLLIGLLGGGAYFLGKSQQEGSWLSGLFNMLPESWQSKLAEWFGPKELEGLSDDERSRLLGHVRAVGGDISDPVSDKLIFRLLTEDPALVEKLASENGTGTPDAKVTEAVRAIVNDPSRLATLLSDKHRSGIFAILDATGKVPLPAGKLQALVEQYGMTDKAAGTLKPAFQTLLTSMVSADTAAIATALPAALKEVPDTALAQIVREIDLNKIPDGAAKEAITAMKANPEAAGSMKRVGTQLQEKGLNPATLMGDLNTLDKQVKFLLTPANREALRPVIGDIAGLARSMAGAETDPDKKLFLGFMGTHARTADGKVSAVNARATLALFDTLGSRGNLGNNTPQTFNVITGMMGLITGDKETAARLTPENMSRFFSNRENANAFGQFLKSINNAALKPEQRQVLAALRTHWGNNDHGIVDLLDDAATLRVLFKARDEGGKSSTTVLDEMNGFTTWLARKTWVGNMYDVTQDMADNWDSLASLQRALINAGVVEGSKPATMPTLADAGAGTQRGWVK